MSQTLHSAAMETVMGFPFAENQVESFFVAARDATYVPVPEHLKTGAAGRYIRSRPYFKSGMYRQQGIASDHLYHRRSVLLSTGTGSGKTDVFLSHALYTLESKPRSTVAGFYTVKALQTDQLDKIKASFIAAGHKEEDIGVINGDDVDEERRLDILNNCRVVLMTPDVLHHWVMKNLDKPQVRKYLKNLSLSFLDEVHTYNEILGHNASLLFKRLQFAVDTLSRGNDDRKPHHNIQFIAASASLRDGPAFMEELTGRKFIEVGPDKDGSRKFDQDVIHLDADDDEQLGVARDLILKILAGKTDIKGTGICFINSRRTVERLASEINLKLGADVVTTYIGGYSTAAREQIHAEIKSGKKRFVIATSVLELGVDFPGVDFGIFVGEPETAASFQQSLGRIGRGIEGLFVVIAPKNAFSKGKNPLGLKGYAQGGIDIKLMKDHPLVLAANAACLQKEMALLGLPENASLRDDVYHWGDHFLKTVNKLRDGLPIFDEEAADHLRNKGRDPHRAFGLRDATPSRSFELVATMLDGSVVKLGTMQQRTAVFECYPGAIFDHRLQKFRVEEWLAQDGKLRIKLKQVRTMEATYPFREQSVFVQIPTVQKPNPLPRARTYASQAGRITECPISIIDKVTGYSIRRVGVQRGQGNSERVNYHNADTPDGKKIRCQTRRRTTGVVFNIASGTFDEDESKKLAKLICDIYVDINRDETGITRRHVDYSVGRVFRNTEEKPIKYENGFVIYDTSTMGLRRTSGLIKDLPEIIKRMPQYPEGAALAGKFKTFYERLTDKQLAKLKMPNEPEAANDSAQDIIPLRTPVLWKGAGKEFGHRNGKANEGVPMVVVGYSTYGNERLYQIEPYDDPSKPKRRRPANESGVARSVPRSALTPIAALGDGG